MSKALKAAVIQLVSGTDLESNLFDALNLMKAAVDGGAQLVLLPENALLFGVDDLSGVVDSSELREAIGSIASFSKDNNCWTLIGSVPAAAPVDQRVYAQSLLFNSNGKQVCSYNKMHLFDVTHPASGETYQESATYCRGAVPACAEIGVHGLGDFEAIMSICYDLRFPEYYRRLMNPKVRLIFVPSAFTYSTGSAHWEALLRARAIENQCFVLAPNQGGLHWNGRRTWGHSMILDPWGNVLGVHKEDPGVVLVDLDFAEQDSVRLSMPCGEHRRL